MKILIKKEIVKTKRLRIFLLIAWTLFVLALISFPTPAYNGDKITYYDKIAHAAMFGVFSFLVALVLHSNKRKRRDILKISFFAGLLFAFLGEFIQLFVPGRSSSELDFLAGVVGIIIISIYGYWRFK